MVAEGDRTRDGIVDPRLGQALSDGRRRFAYSTLAHEVSLRFRQDRIGPAIHLGRSKIFQVSRRMNAPS